MTALLRPAWTDPLSGGLLEPGFQSPQDRALNPPLWGIGLGRRTTRSIATLENGPFFRLRSILGAWMMRLLPQDPATVKLARYNREHRPLGRVLPPSHDLTLHFRREMPIVLPIYGVAR